MSTGANKRETKCFVAEEKICYYTCYAEDNDITFIMKDRMINDEPVTSECIGWYHGEPNKGYTEEQVQEYLNGEDTNVAHLEPDVLKFKDNKV